MAAKQPSASKANPKKKTLTKKASGKKASVKKTKSGKSTSSGKNATSKQTTSKESSPKKPAANKAPAKKPTVKKSSLKQTASTASTATSGPRTERKATSTTPAKRSFAQNITVNATAKANRSAGGKAGSGSKAVAAATGRASFGSGSGSLPAHHGEAISLDELSASQLKRAKSGLKRKELHFFRTELLERRAEILGDVANLDLARNDFGGEISHVPLHMADVGSENYDREFNLGLLESEKKLLRQIDEALLRIANGTYGVCHVTGRPIERIRLEIKPWAKYGIEIARERERRGLAS